jgi:hypothetical protein
MDFKTKYDIGYRYYTPRCLIRSDTVSKVIDGETWRRDEDWYEPFVKHKEIVGIQITSNERGTTYTYMTITVGDTRGIPSHTKEESITDYTYDEAFAKAVQYADMEQEYFG